MGCRAQFFPFLPSDKISEEDTATPSLLVISARIYLLIPSLFGRENPFLDEPFLLNFSTERGKEPVFLFSFYLSI